MRSQIIINGKEVDKATIVIDGIDTRDYPDFCDSYISECEFIDGAELNEHELDELKERLDDEWIEMIMNSLY
jgi:hypothetical protein